MNRNFEVSGQTAVENFPEKENCDKNLVYQILDEGSICHVGFTIDDQPYVVPVPYARIGENLIIHGSKSNLMMRALSWEIDVCVTVTLINESIVTRSAFDSAVNYRCVMIFGRAKYISDELKKYEALRCFTERITPNGWAEIPLPNDSELASTTVLTLSLEDAATKISCGEPRDHEADHETEVLAGIIPF